MSAMTMPFFDHAGGALIASPSSELRQQVLHRLNGRCRLVQQTLGGAEALAKLEKGEWQVLFLDRRLPDLDADELIAIIGRRFPGIQVVLLDSDSAGQEQEEQEEDESGKVDAPPDLPASGQPAPEPGKMAVTVAPLPGMIGTSDPGWASCFRSPRSAAC